MNSFVTLRARDSDIGLLSTPETPSKNAEIEAKAPNISRAADLAATGKCNWEKTQKYSMQYSLY